MFVFLLTGHSWDQAKRSQHSKGSEGFDVETSWFPSVAVHGRMGSNSFLLSIFGQNFQDNTKQSKKKEKKSVRKITHQ